MGRVLVVENNRMIRTTYAAGIAGYGHEVLEADGVSQALSALQSGFDPKAVLLDLHLLDGDGKQVIEFIRDDMGRHDIRIIVATGMQVNIDEIVGMGADAVLNKPVDLADIFTYLTGR